MITVSIVAFEREHIVSFFLNPQTETDMAVFQLACNFLIIVSLMQIFNEIDTTSVAVLMGIKDTKVPLLINLVSHWVVGIGGIYLLAFHWQFQETGLLICYYLPMVLTAIVSPCVSILKPGLM